MNLDELRTVQSKERQKDSLQHLRPSFYQEVGEYIATLEAERERVAEAVDDPFSSPEVGRLTDEIETAKDVVEAIYERRMGKLVKQASLAAAGMPATDEGLTAEEADLFEDLVERIQGNKTRVLEVLDSGGAEVSAAGDDHAGTDPTSTTPEPPAPEAASASDGVSVADAMGGELPAAADADHPQGGSSTDSMPAGTEEELPPPPPPEEPPLESVETDSDGTAEPDSADKTPSSAADSSPKTAGLDHRRSDESVAGDGPETDSETESDVDRVTVKITRDVGSILGIDDREYTLSSEDIVTLPEQNATPLVEREAAEPLE